MARTGNELPTGFLGPVRGWGSLVPSSRSALQLPRELDRLAEPASAVLDLIEVSALTESLGRVEVALRDLAARLADDGTLLLDVDNVQSARMLRMVIEGRPGSFDPSGSSQDPSQALPLRRVLAAAAAAGLTVRDVVHVPSGAEEFAPELARSLFGSGLLPLDWLGGAPPSRFWLQCEKAPGLAGSVLVAGSGDRAAFSMTTAALRAFLPEDWEIVRGDAIDEAAQWNRAIAAARGDVVWFVRAGSRPAESTFRALATRAGVGAVAPCSGATEPSGGDVSGLMMPRLDVLLVGPMPESVNGQIALEEWSMRLESKLPPVWPIEVPFATPRPPIERPDTFATEADEMVERWSVVDESPDAAPLPQDVPSDASATPWAGRAPRITLCMIARDEERFLGECLRRASGAFDEFVLVDTGSTDRTVEIAEAHGAIVVHEPWDDDFSSPRNLGLARATGDWILVLDADEFVVDGGCETIRELVGNPTALGYHLRFVNDYGGGKTLGVMMVRLFRNLPGLEYQNVIHEQVTPSLQRLGAPLGLTLLSSDVEIEHHGYADEVMDRRGKNERNERLFQKQLEQAPDDIYSHYKYGDFLRRVPGRGEDARRMLERCLELIVAGSPTLPRELPYASEVAALCALEAERHGTSRRAREVVDLALRRFVPTPNLHYMAASLALADRDADTAIHHYRRCLAYRDQVLVVPIQEGITSYVSLVGIAQAWLLRGDRARGRRLLEQAIEIEPSYEVARLALSRLHLESGDAGSALHVLTEFLARYPESPGACQQTMLILKRLGRNQAAREMGHHTVRLLEARALDREARAVHQILAGL